MKSSETSGNIFISGKHAIQQTVSDELRLSHSTVIMNVSHKEGNEL